MRCRYCTRAYAGEQCSRCFGGTLPGLQLAQGLVEEFHAKFGCTIGGSIAIRDANLRADLHQEENAETEEAMFLGDVAETVDGLCDLIYVALGTAVAMGVDLWPVFREVHRSNMTKTPGDVRDDGKINKGPTYSPPDIAGCLRAQGWKP